MHYFCTYFDHNYLPLGLALYRSLKQHSPEFKLWVLCLSSTCYDVLKQLDLPDINLISLNEFERGDEALLGAKQNRSLIEYYFTCSPSLPLFVLNKYPEVDLITYLDADLFFFSDISPIYEEIADASIAIIEHRFSSDRLELVKFGIYNVGWLSFRRDENGFACLHWWREKCIEWCYDRPENGRFADQKYLDDWPARFSNVVVLQNKGANVGHWNTNNYQIFSSKNRIWVDEEPLIFFHFHAFKYNKNKFEEMSLNPNIKVGRFSDREIYREIYGSYIATLRETKKMVAPLLPNVSLQSNIRGQAIPANSEKQNQATTSQPNSANTYKNLAVTLEQENQPEKAIIYYQRAVALKPDWIEVRQHLTNLMQKLVSTRTPLRVMVGSASLYEPGWLSTDVHTLNLLNIDDWEKYFSNSPIDAILGEHVWEHLTKDDGVRAAKICYKYLKRGGYLRVAVPDGFHPSDEYINWVKPGGTGSGAEDHKIIYNYTSLREVFEKAGFRVNLLEYFDEKGQFNFTHWNENEGKIYRSKRFDERNKDGKLNYTSIILDAIKR